MQITTIEYMWLKWTGSLICHYVINFGCVERSFPLNGFLWNCMRGWFIFFLTLIRICILLLYSIYYYKSVAYKPAYCNTFQCGAFLYSNSYGGLRRWLPEISGGHEQNVNHISHGFNTSCLLQIYAKVGQTGGLCTLKSTERAILTNIVRSE